jgi:hypothetical protein
MGEKKMANNKFTNMRIKRIIIHQIYKRDEANIMVPPFLSSACCIQDFKYTSKVRDRIVNSMGKESHSIRMEIVDHDEKSVYKAISDYWQDNTDDEKFIELSKSITQMLSETQNSRRYPDCAVICIDGTVQEIDKPFFCIIKAERQDGFSLKLESESLNLSYIDEIFMTKNEKFQKIGIFIDNAIRGRDIEPKDVDTFIFDSNTDSSISKSKAEYFYKTFLGLGFRRDSNLLTLNFVEHTKNFINGLNEINDINKIELSTALLSYIKAEGRETINPSDFAKDNFENPELIDKYTNYLTQHSIDMSSIHKDTSMLGNILKVRKLVFSNNVKLQIPADEFEDSIELSKNDAGETIIKIKGLMLDEK